MVRKLFLLGTPNAGSLCSDPSQTWARATLALGFNRLTTMTWPASVIGPLAALVEFSDTALGVDGPLSPLLKELATSPDPGIPYVLLAGSSSVIAGWRTPGVPALTPSPDCSSARPRPPACGRRSRLP